MTESKPNPIFRLMPSLTDIAFLMPVIFLFTRLDGVRTLLLDGDTGWHIRTGEWILAHHAVPRGDIFSFTRPGEPWFAWEWLWDAGAGWLHERWGLGAVVLASILVLCLTFALLYRLVNRRCGNGLIALLVTALAAAGSTMHWLARPHLLTLLFVVIFLSILDRVREGRTRLLWWLPALTVLWANLHGGFVAGLVILGAYGAGELIHGLLAQDAKERRGAARASIPYFAAIGGCLAASLVNPYFYHLHVHIWQYLHDPFVMDHINEFQSANFRYGSSGFYEAMLVLGLGASIWCMARKNFGDALLFAGWGHIGLLSARNIPIFMIVAAPVVAPAIVAWLKTLENAPVPGWLRASAEVAGSAYGDISDFEKMWRTHAICAIVLAFIGLGMATPGAGEKLNPEFDAKAFPAKALALLQDPSERIFTSDQWGDYLIYNLSPKGIKVFFDGRSDFYGPKFCQEYIDVMDVKYNWEQTLSRYGIDTVLLPANSALASTMKESNGWRMVHDDGAAIVFRLSRPRSGQNSISAGVVGGKHDPRITHKEG